MIENSTLKTIKENIKAIADTDKEICGVVVQTKKGIEIRQITNSSDGKSTHYQMSPQALSEATQDTDLFRKKAENTLIGIWHTHPHNSSRPSQIDVNTCLMNRNYIIYSVRDDTITVFRIQVG